MVAVGTAEEDLGESIKGLLAYELKIRNLYSRKQHQGPEQDEAQPPETVWRSFFNIEYPSVVTSALPSNVHVLTESQFSLSYDAAVAKAEAIFKLLCPDAEFIPKVPNPEDIIFV